MKKNLPYIILGVGFLVFVVAIAVFVMKRNSRPAKQVADDTEETVAELPVNQKPFISFTPSAGFNPSALKCNLTLKVEHINRVPGSPSTMDYEILYKVKDGRTQGVPATIKLTGDQNLSRDILFGSESSGKIRCDEGVETGSVTLRFRDSDGKLMSKVSSDFHLVTATDSLTSTDNSFTYTLAKKPKNGYFLILNTGGYPDSEFNQTLKSGPIGVFKSESDIKYPGNVKMDGKTFYWENSNWTEKSTDLPDVGVFVSSSS